MKTNSRKRLSIALAIIIGLSVNGCANMSADQKNAMGCITGGALGALLGSQVGKGKGRTTAMIAGAAGGCYAGSRVAQYLNEVERAKLEQNTVKALALTPVTEQNEMRWDTQDKSESVDLIVHKGETDKVNALSTAKNVDQNVASSLPEESSCRYVTSGLERARVSETGVYCRTAEGDYVRVGDAPA